jgi:sugar O-acyltransferase (sialic acid O-acetyltransferase NeuD family)
MARLVIFGAGKIADEAYFYFTNDSPHRIVAFTVDEGFLTAREKWGLPVVPFEALEDRYPPGDVEAFVAVGYQGLNTFRAQKYEEIKRRGYTLVSFVSSRASNFGGVEMGDNCFVLENAVIQPCSRIGRNVFIWSGNHVGHHASIGDHCYLTGQVMVAGSAIIEPYCFLGVNSTVGHEVRVGEGSFIGAGALVTKNVPPRSVYIREDTPRYRLDAPSFLRLTKMK